MTCCTSYIWNQTYILLVCIKCRHELRTQPYQIKRFFTNYYSKFELTSWNLKGLFVLAARNKWGKQTSQHLKYLVFQPLIPSHHETPPINSAQWCKILIQPYSEQDILNRSYNRGKAQNKQTHTHIYIKGVRGENYGDQSDSRACSNSSRRENGGREEVGITEKTRVSWEESGFMVEAKWRLGCNGHIRRLTTAADYWASFLLLFDDSVYDL